MNIRILACAAIFGALPAASSATAIWIDFSDYAPGTLLSSAPGITLSMSGGPGGGSVPVIGYGYFDSVLSLNNSENWGLGSSGYPTNAVLTIDFTKAASDVRFTFNNYGVGNGTAVRIYGPGNSFLGTFALDIADGFIGNVLAPAGIKRLEFDNASGGQYDWIFGIGALTFRPVPEPASWALMIAGFGIVGLAARRRRNLPARAF